jgi:hypothetical protein
MRTLCFAVLVTLGLPAVAQEAASQTAAIDEVVVPGRRPENLRVEIERLETAVYARWNTLNSNDDLDIHCLEQAPTGSNIPLRTCAPNFVIEAESRDMTKILRDGRTGAGNNYNRAEHDARMQKLSQQLTEEMQRIARQDEQLLRDLVRLDELRQMRAGEQAQRANN